MYSQNSPSSKAEYWRGGSPFRDEPMLTVSDLESNVQFIRPKVNYNQNVDRQKYIQIQNKNIIKVSEQIKQISQRLKALKRFLDTSVQLRVREHSIEDQQLQTSYFGQKQKKQNGKTDYQSKLQNQDSRPKSKSLNHSSMQIPLFKNEKIQWMKKKMNLNKSSNQHLADRQYERLQNSIQSLENNRIILNKIVSVYQQQNNKLSNQVKSLNHRLDGINYNPRKRQSEISIIQNCYNESQTIKNKQKVLISYLNKQKILKLR